MQFETSSQQSKWSDYLMYEKAFENAKEQWIIDKGMSWEKFTTQNMVELFKALSENKKSYN